MRKFIILISILVFTLVTYITARAENRLKITTPAFTHNQPIPSQYTCDGEDINPPFEISGIPQGTKTLALIVDDPDAPFKTWVHWVVFNIPVLEEINPSTALRVDTERSRSIKENKNPGVQGRNDFRRNKYGGPCPPSGTHRYFFKLYALDTELTLTEGASKEEIEQAMEGHVLAKTELVGLYSKQ